MLDKETRLYWYAAYTKINQELIIKKRLDALGVENYLAMREELDIYQDGSVDVFFVD